MAVEINFVALCAMTRVQPVGVNVSEEHIASIVRIKQLRRKKSIAIQKFGGNPHNYARFYNAEYSNMSTRYVYLKNANNNDQ